MKSIFRRSRYRRRNPSQQPFFQPMGGESEYAADGNTFFPPAAVGVQAKLTIGQPNDKYEREADAMADRVVNHSSAPAAGPAHAPPIQAKCAECEEKGVQRMTQEEEPEVQKMEKEEEPEVQKMEKEEPEVQKMEEEEPEVQKMEKEEEETVQAKPSLMRQTGSGQSVGTLAFASQLGSSKGSGQPLAPATAAHMGQAFGRDFSSVRVHTDGKAAEMNKGINARAFTHGADIYFNKGEYRPESSQGKRLLAHELTHTVQQGGGIKREALTEDIHGPGSMVQRNSSDQDTSQGNQVAPPAPATGPAPQTNTGSTSCSHTASALSWSDFTGSVPSSNFGAVTSFKIELKSKVTKAMFLGGQSWVKSRFKKADQRDANGCKPVVKDCKDWYDANPNGSGYGLTPDGNCPAGIIPTAKADSKTECETVLGTDCDTAAKAESKRLLRHEQYHYALACELAKKGTAKIASGGDPQQTHTKAVSLGTEQTATYDSETHHGCNQSKQTAWETKIDNGLSNVTI
jgi:hypothetical protein